MGLADSAMLLNLDTLGPDHTPIKINLQTGQNSFGEFTRLGSRAEMIRTPKREHRSSIQSAAADRCGCPAERSCHELAWRNAVNAPNPARQVTLIRKARCGCDICQTMSAIAHQLTGALQPKMHNIAVRRHADRSGKYPREVKRAEVGDGGERSSLDALADVGQDIVPDPLERLLVSLAAELRGAVALELLRRAPELSDRLKYFRLLPLAAGIDQRHFVSCLDQPHTSCLVQETTAAATRSGCSGNSA